MADNGEQGELSPVTRGRGDERDGSPPEDGESRRDPDADRTALARADTVHFVGIGGIGMSALALLLTSRGKRVTGSDVKDSPLIEKLRSTGITVQVGHSASAVGGADLVVATSAARPDNPELAEARRRRVPVVKRAELLGWLMAEGFGVAVAGTHGKTTTTGMVAFLLHRAGLDPTALVGGEPLDFESHGLVGRGPYLVAEADEFDRSILQFWPKVAVITSVEADHLDCYADLDDIAHTFQRFASRVPPDGLLVTYHDDPILSAMLLPVPRQSYGFASGADWRLLECDPLSPFGTRFRFAAPDGSLHECRLRLSGRHYALNALAAIATAVFIGVDAGQAATIMGGFRGTRRRFELLGEAGGVVVIDDYAHHPTAVRETLRSARERHAGEVWCVFQPHTVNRTEKLLGEFARAFDDCDHVLMLPIYHPAGREEVGAVTSADLVAAMAHPDARPLEGLGDAVSTLAGAVKSGDMVITMGAGDVNRVGEELLEELRG